MRGLADRGITVFVSSHLLAEIEAICDHLVMIDSGRIVFQGGDRGVARRRSTRSSSRPPSTPTTPARWSRCASRRATQRASTATRSASRPARTGRPSSTARRWPPASRCAACRSRAPRSRRRSSRSPSRRRGRRGRLMLGASRASGSSCAAGAMLAVGPRRRRCSSRCSRRSSRSSARSTLQPGFHGHGFRVTFAVLEQPNGLVHGIVDVSSLIGIVALCLFAGAFATEYSQGTLRNLLVREPRRAGCCRGKFLALAALHRARRGRSRSSSRSRSPSRSRPGKGINTSAWTSSTGLNDLFQSRPARVSRLRRLRRARHRAGGPPALAGGRDRRSAVAYLLPIEAIIVGAIW